MYARLAAGARQHLRFERERVQEIIDALCSLVGIEALAQLRVLRGDADRAASGVAVIAIAGRNADLVLEIRLRDLFVAVQRHQHRVPNSDGVGAKRHGLRYIAAVPDAPGVNQTDLAALAKLVDGPARLADSGNSRHAGILGGDMRPRPGAALHCVDIDGVRSALHGHAHVVINARRAELELNRDLPIGRLAHLLNLERKIIGAEPVWMTSRRALIEDRKSTRLNSSHTV